MMKITRRFGTYIHGKTIHYKIRDKDLQELSNIQEYPNGPEPEISNEINTQIGWTTTDWQKGLNSINLVIEELGADFRKVERMLI